MKSLTKSMKKNMERRRKFMQILAALLHCWHYSMGQLAQQKKKTEENEFGKPMCNQMGKKYYTSLIG